MPRRKEGRWSNLEIFNRENGQHAVLRATREGQGVHVVEEGWGLGPCKQRRTGGGWLVLKYSGKKDKILAERRALGKRLPKE